VLGRHIESLHFLEIMMGKELPLNPAQRFYQRALSGNSDEATEQLEECLNKEKSLARCYDEVVLEALMLAQVDVLRGTLDDGHASRVNHVVRSLLAELEDQDLAKDESASDQAVDEKVDDRRPVEAGAPGRSGVVLCVGGPGAFDGVAAEMLAQLLRREGCEARIEADAAISSLTINQLDTENVELICLSHINLGQVSVQLRYAVRRMRRRVPAATIVACMWGHHGGEVAPADVAALGADACALSMSDAVRICCDARCERPVVLAGSTAA
jgi:hypothetical protein